MARSPFYKIVLQKSGRDISDQVSKISFEDATDQDSLLVINMKTITTELIDSADLKEGNIITVQFGYIGGKQSKTISLRISDIILRYGDTIDLTINATDMGIVLKKKESQKVWKNVRASDIAVAIANANGLTPKVDRTEKVYDFMPQGGKNDYEFLKHLSAIEKNGSWRFFIQQEKLVFNRIALDSKSKKTITYNDGDGVVISFNPFSQEVLKKAEARNTVITTVDPFTNKPVQTVINDASAKDDVKLGEYAYHFNQNAEQVSSEQNQQRSYNLITNARPSDIQAAKQQPESAGKHTYMPNQDQGEAVNFGNFNKKKKSMKDYRATLVVEGDPDYESDTIISMANVSKKDSGNWYVVRAKHVVDYGGGYMVHLSLQKNAGKKQIEKGSKKQTNVNNTTAPNQKDNTPVKTSLSPIYFDENGKRVYTSDFSRDLITNKR